MLSLLQSFTRKKYCTAISTGRRPLTIIGSTGCLRAVLDQHQQQVIVRWMMAGGKRRPKKGVDVEMNSRLMKRLAPSVRMRHVQKFCDKWFSADHLRSDVKLRSHIQCNKGWCQFKLLLNRRKFRDWTNENLLKDAFRTATPRGTYQIKEEGGKKFVQRFDIQNQLAESKKLPGPKPPILDLYDTDREVVVVPGDSADDDDDHDALKETCERLSKADCLGMHVEFAPLPGRHDDDDNTATNTRPPAMIQLASDDLVALIWLHKLPHHGKSVLKYPVKYNPLLKLLASEIPKVGFGLPKQVFQLAFFWGMTSKSDFKRHQRNAVKKHFKQLIDLRREHRATDGKNLYQLCSRILGVKLPSKRYLLRSSLVYRSDRMSRKLKDFAARKAACQLDIWRAIQEKKARFRQNNRTRSGMHFQPPSCSRGKRKSRL